MIIELDNSLVERLKKEASFDGAAAAALDNIANAQREGHHIIYADLETLEELRLCSEWLGRRTVAILARAANKYPQLAFFAKRVCVKLVVGDFDDVAIRERNGCKEILYPVGGVTTRLLQRTLLLVENLTDAVFYQWVAGSAPTAKQFGDFFLAMEPYPGGGNTTAEAYDNIKQNTERLCLCIVDSDVRCPGTQEGETALKVKRSDNRAQNCRVEYHVLEACSVENLIPFEMFDSAWNDDRNYADRLNRYRQLHVDDVWPFIRLKKEIKCVDLKSASAFSSFWRRTLACEEIKDGCGAGFEGSNCGSRDECQMVVLPALSKSPLNAALSLLEKEVQVSDFSLLPRVEAAWSEISRQIISWCCGTPPLVAA